MSFSFKVHFSSLFSTFFSVQKYLSLLFRVLYQFQSFFGCCGRLFDENQMLMLNYVYVSFFFTDLTWKIWGKCVSLWLGCSFWDIVGPYCMNSNVIGPIQAIIWVLEYVSSINTWFLSIIDVFQLKFRLNFDPNTIVQSLKHILGIAKIPIFEHITLFHVPNSK